MFNLMIAEYTGNKVTILARPEKHCSKFEWKGYNASQTFEVISTTKTPVLEIETKELLKKYAQVVCYASDEENCYISSYLPINGLETKPLEIIPIKSKSGFDLFFSHQVIPGNDHPICERYKLFGIKDGKTKCISDTAEFLTHVKNFTYDDYYAEGYKKEIVDGVNTCILRYKSNIIHADMLREHSDDLLGPHDAQNIMYTDLTVCIVISDPNSLWMRAIDSVLASLQCRISIVLIDNTKDDATHKAGKWYHENYPNVIYECIETSDSGTSHNLGIQMAATKTKSTYTTFLSPNEVIHPTSYKKMVSQAKCLDKDIIFARYVDYVSDHEINIESDISDYLDIKTPHLDFIRAEEKRLTNWHKIVKTNILASCKYPENTNYPTKATHGNAELSQAILTISAASSFALAADTIYGCNHPVVSSETTEKDNFENILFTALVYPVHRILHSDEEENNIDNAIHFVLKRFSLITLPLVLNDKTTPINAAKLSLIIKHILDNHRVTYSPKYNNDVMLKRTLKNVITANKNVTDPKVFKWLIDTEYLEKGIG